MILTRIVISLFLFIFFDVSGRAQALTGGGEANPDLKTNQRALVDWRDRRFGMFIHWGPVSLRGTEIGWSRGREVPVGEYDQLYKKFNPIEFDADEWIGLLKDAGMKYLVVVSKHHDGFVMWDSETTDYDIMSTPYGRDVLKDLSEACKRLDILFGTYYSIADWRHPDYPVEHMRDRKKPGADMDRYIEYMKAQIRELVHDYNTKILWFDGEWEEPWTHQMGMDLYAYVRSLDNDILINNRVDKGRKGMEGISISNKYAGDFATPEQQIGRFDTLTPWESCITIGKQWAWKPDDRLKSAEECIEILVRTVGGDGNLLLNIGPRPDGTIEPRQADRLREIGSWLDKYGESIYNTRGGPLPPHDWGVTTRRDHSVYLHILGKNKLLNINFTYAVKEITLLGDQTPVTFHQESSDLKILLPETGLGPVNMILKAGTQ